MKQGISNARRRVLAVGSVSVQADQKIGTTFTGNSQNPQGSVLPDTSVSVTNLGFSTLSAGEENPSCVNPTQSQIF